MKVFNRAYALLDIKQVDDDKRIIEGIASTPETDRMGDVIESEGAEFQLPIPFLWQHDKHSPIGHVIEATVTKKGMSIKAQIAASGISEQIDNAWKLIRAKLVRGLSIGFRALDTEDIPNSWGVIFKKWELLEISAVTIAANASATIHTIRSIDTELRAASGQSQGDERSGNPGVSGKNGHANRVVNIKPQTQRSSAMDIAGQIKSFEDARVLKADRMTAIMEEAGKKGETLNAEQTEEYDGLEAEVKSLDDHLKRLRALETDKAKTAKLVDKTGTTDETTRTRDPALHTTVRAGPKLEPGVRFARLAKCKGLAALFNVDAVKIAEDRYKDDPSIATILKANVLGGATIAGNWATNLVGDETSAFADFVTFLRPMTIVGKFGAGGVPSLRAVPFRVPLIGETAGGEGYWVGEGKPKPLTSFDFSRTTLEPLKVANIAVATMELLRDSSPSADLILRDSLAKALQARLDTDFIDPGKAASAGVSPASILNGIAAIASTGNNASDIREDIRLLFNAFIAANNPPTSGVWIMSASTALALSLMQNPLGQAEFPGVSMAGGNLFGLPVIVSEYVTSVAGSGGTHVALVNASDIYLGDEGGVDVDISREASLQMLDNPTNDSVTPTATSMVSLWQTNSVGFRAERTINWKRRRDSAVAYLGSVHWGEGS